MELVKPSIFSSGDFDLWIQKFDICANANKWKDAEKAVYLPTFLEGEALNIYLNVSRKSVKYEEIISALKKNFGSSPTKYLEIFNHRDIKPGESFSGYAFHIQRLLQMALPSIDEESANKLLLNRFVSGISKDIAAKIKLMTKINSLDEAVEAAKKASDAIENEPHIAAVQNGLIEQKISKLEEQVQQLAQLVKNFATMDRFERTPCQSKKSNYQNTRKKSRYAPSYSKSVNNIESINIDNCDYTCLLDTGSCVSLVSADIVQKVKARILTSDIKLILASGTSFKTSGSAEINFRYRGKDLTWTFIIAPKLIYPIIIGTDLLEAMGIRMFMSCTVSDHANHVQMVEEITSENLFIPSTQTLEILPECPSKYRGIISKHKNLFSSTPKLANVVPHKIITENELPIRIPPRRIPFHYKHQVHNQIHNMLDRGIISPSSSSWMYPAVYVPKKHGSIRICVDYRKLNEITKKDSYPIPLVDDVQTKLAGCSVFSTLDLYSGYWQIPIDEKDKEKTAFCPSPEMGLYQFNVMPFGLCGAPSTFQRSMNNIFKDLDCVMVYLDDILIFSKDHEQHKKDLLKVFQVLEKANLSLNAKKCNIAASEVKYLGFVISKEGRRPDPEKIKAIAEWNFPKSVSELKSFIGLASYYRAHIRDFARLARPLFDAMKEKELKWDEKTRQAFNTLKLSLCNAPVLVYPKIGVDFSLYTDASSSAIGATLEQSGHPVAYVSRVLTSPETRYSTIEKECLAIVFAMKKFRQYLIGRKFTLYTDHKPLTWLKSQKLEGRIGRWILSIQDLDFDVVYLKGESNKSADGLSRSHVAPVFNINHFISLQQLKTNQYEDPVICEIITNIKNLDAKKLQSPEAVKYSRIGHQLLLKDGILYRKYSPNFFLQNLVVPVIPPCLRKVIISKCHDDIISGHFSEEKTLARVKEIGSWIGLNSDVQRYVEACKICQESNERKLAKPSQSLPIGSPWEFVSIDILELTQSRNGYKYLLVIHDSFSKWLEAIPLVDQTSKSIVAVLRDIFARMGFPQVLHSDQGANMESALVDEFCKDLNIKKTHTTTYYPQGNPMAERSNRTILNMLRKFVENFDWCEKLPLLLYAYRTAIHSSTKLSPYEIIFGRKPRSLIIEQSKEFQVGIDQVKRQERELAKMRDFVEQNISEDSRRKYTHVPEPIEIGSEVLVRKPTRTKFDRKWTDGWIVRSRVRPGIFKVENQLGISKTVNSENIKVKKVITDTTPSFTYQRAASQQTGPGRRQIRPPSRYRDYVQISAVGM